MRLAQKCRLVEGAKRAAIYDLEKGSVYSLNEAAREVVAGRRKNDQFWRKLLEMGLGEETNGNGTTVVEDIVPEIGLNFMWLELTEKCNLRCVHCYAGSGPQAGSRSLEVTVWKRTIKEGMGLGCKRVQLTGGEVLTHKGIFDLAAFAKEIGYTFVEIFTNATLLTPGKARVIRELGLHVATSFYSSEAAIHDQITQTRGSFKKTYQALQLLSELDVPTRVAIIVMKQNESTVAQTQYFVRGLGVRCEKVDIIRSVGRGCASDLLPGEEIMKRWGLMKPNFQTSRERFALYHHWNSCWAGKIAITSSGDVLPCIFSRKHVVGNVVQNSLEEIVSGGGLQKLWRLTKDDVDVCRDCEYRYACQDCRPLAEAQTGNLNAKFPRCTYNPYTGIWGE